MDIKILTEEKLKILESVYYALVHADNNKIIQANNKHFSNDNWLEEECTPNYPTIKVKLDGISNTLFINDTNCLSDNFEP